MLKTILTASLRIRNTANAVHL